MENKDIKIFLTWWSWFIWGYFLKKLLWVISDGSIIYCSVRKNNISIKDKRIIILNWDLDNIECFQKEILESDYVYHLWANATYGNDIDYNLVNYEPTKKLIDILSGSKSLKNFIFVSTVWVCDRSKKDNVNCPLTINSVCSPKSKYGLSKLKAEKYLRKASIPFTIIRPTRVYGPNMRQNSHINAFVDLIYGKKFFAKMWFQWKVSLIHVNDLATALVHSINNDKILYKTYFAATENLSLWDIFKQIYITLFKKQIKQIYIPRFQWLFSKIHHYIPLSIANLFLDYLCVENTNFTKDFLVWNFTRFEHWILDVIKNNATIYGSRIITGANSGIWYELSKLLYKNGKKLVLIDKDISNLDHFSNASVVKFDLTNIQEIPNLCENIIEQNKNIRVLINNAGVGFRWDFNNLTISKIRTTIDVNIYAPIMITHHLLPYLIKNKSIIVNIGSSSGFFPLPWMSLYAATKAFINSRSNALRYELKNKCYVISVSPSWTNTNFQNNAWVKKNEKEKLLEPYDVAEKIINAIQKRQSFVLLWGKTKILLLVLKFLPKKIALFLLGKTFEKSR